MADTSTKKGTPSKTWLTVRWREGTWRGNHAGRGSYSRDTRRLRTGDQRGRSGRSSIPPEQPLPRASGGAGPARRSGRGGGTWDHHGRSRPGISWGRIGRPHSRWPDRPHLGRRHSGRRPPHRPRLGRHHPGRLHPGTHPPHGGGRCWRRGHRNWPETTGRRLSNRSTCRSPPSPQPGRQSVSCAEVPDGRPAEVKATCHIPANRDLPVVSDMRRVTVEKTLRVATVATCTGCGGSASWNSWSDVWVNTPGDEGGGVGERLRSASDETFAAPKPTLQRSRMRSGAYSATAA